MGKVKIITDSSAQLTDEEIKENSIGVVPLTITIDDETFVDGVDISHEEFVQKMHASKDLPTTSQPSIGTFMDLIDNISDEYTEILSLNMTESISGTVNAAKQVIEMTDKKMTVIDTNFTDRAMSFQVIEAAKMSEAGKSLEEITARLDEIRANTRLYMGVTTIENILKGGRLSRFAGTLSSLLNINLVLTLKNNSLDIAKRGRGRKVIDNYLKGVIDEIKGLDNIKSIGISYVDNMDFVNELQEKIKEVHPDLPILIRVTSPVIATHAGRGAFAIEFYTD